MRTSTQFKLFFEQAARGASKDNCRGSENAFCVSITFSGDKSDTSTELTEKSPKEHNRSLTM